MSKDSENNLDYCIICLDELDSDNNNYINSCDLLITACECKYNIHRSCFNQWLNTRNNSSNVNCLICGSEGQIIVSRREKCKRKCLQIISPKTFCAPVIWIVILFFLLIVGSQESQENNDDSQNS